MSSTLEQPYKTLTHGAQAPRDPLGDVVHYATLAIIVMLALMPIAYQIYLAREVRTSASLIQISQLSRDVTMERALSYMDATNKSRYLSDNGFMSPDTLQTRMAQDRNEASRLIKWNGAQFNVFRGAVMLIAGTPFVASVILFLAWLGESRRRRSARVKA
jgi:hypothetical protein